MQRVLMSETRRDKDVFHVILCPAFAFVLDQHSRDLDDALTLLKEKLVADGEAR